MNRVRQALEFPPVVPAQAGGAFQHREVLVIDFAADPVGKMDCEETRMDPGLRRDDEAGLCQDDGIRAERDWRGNALGCRHEP